MTKPHYPTLTNARLTSGFGWRIHPVTRRQSTHHDGIDLAPARAGTTGVPIYAVADGIVRNREYNKISGNRIYIEHTQDSYTSVYCHLASFNVKRGQRVKRGQLIGRMGSTGASTGIHLHFGVSKSYPVRWSTTGTSNGSFINPVTYLNQSFPKTVSKSVQISNLKVDGYWGRNTTRALQRSLGTPSDGEIWGQVRNAVTKNITGIKYGKGGSPMIKALQRKVGSKADGYLGPNTIRALQRYLKTPADGEIWKPSSMVKELQRRLNAGTF